MTDEGRVIVVTGGTSGIGSAVVDWFSERSARNRVVVVDIRRPAQEVHSFVEADLSEPDQITAALDSVTGPIDVLVNNVGGGFPSNDPTWPDPATWRRFLDLNLTSAYLVTASFRDRIVEGGHICNISSIAGLGPWPAFPAYGAAKAGLVQLTQSLAATFAGRQIKVNSVAPGYLYTSSWAELVDPDAFAAIVSNRTMLGSAQTPDEVAELVGFLCSAANQSITGQVVAIDGGASLGPAYVYAGEPSQSRG